MYIFLVDKNRKVLYPTQRRKLVAKWIRNGQARYLRSNKVLQVFIKLPKTKIINHIDYNLGIDPGYINIGYCVTKINKITEEITILVRGVFELNTPDIKKNLTNRKMYRNIRRRHRRQRNLRRKHSKNIPVKFRVPRWRNRLNKSKLTPTVRYVIDNHINAINKIHNRCKINNIHIEYNKFDLHKLVNPNVYGYKYQQGPKYNLNISNQTAYVLTRDNYTCQVCNTNKPGTKFEVHHIQPRSKNGSDYHSNLITLCNKCHSKIHKTNNFIQFNIEDKINLRQASIINTAMKYIVSEITNLYNTVTITYGSVTKYLRNLYNQNKNHDSDAMFISLSSCDGIIYNIQNVEFNKYITNYTRFKRHTRSFVYAYKDRVYTINGNKVAYNRRVRTGESNKISLEEFKQLHSKQYKQYEIKAIPAKTVYNTLNSEKLFTPGDIIQVNNKLIPIKGYSKTQRKVFDLNGDYYSFRNVNKKLDNSGFVII